MKNIKYLIQFIYEDAPNLAHAGGLCSFSPRLKCLFAQRALGVGHYVQPHVELVLAFLHHARHNRRFPVVETKHVKRLYNKIGIDAKNNAKEAIAPLAQLIYNL